ncbi:MAG: nitroreductase family protein [Clostridia bacterium]|nr:nitroreductase family protein [Clostridia bacterium]
MTLLEEMYARRSVRKYSDEPVPQEKLNMIIEAGLLGCTGRNTHSPEFIVVTDKALLEKLSHARVGAAKMLEGAGAAIITLGNAEKTDTWVEDASIALENMHLMADSLGLGSCWIQGKGREAENGESTEEYVRKLTGFADNLKLVAILSIGCIEEGTHPKGYTKDDLDFERVKFI